MNTATRARIRQFGTGQAEARVAARYANFDATEMHRVQVASNRARQEATMENKCRNTEHAHLGDHAYMQFCTPQPQAVTRQTADKLIAASAERTPWVPEATIWQWLPTVTEADALAKLAWVQNQPVAQRNEVQDEPRPASTPHRTRVEVPEGRYAVRGADGVVKFYHVDRPTEGRWAGYVFVKVQASDELHNLRSRDTRNAVLAAIAEAGIEASMALYGQELGKCGHCGRTLTDEESRSYGIGPVCRGKMGF